jgi:hypothetical protein
MDFATLAAMRLASGNGSIPWPTRLNKGEPMSASADRTLWLTADGVIINSSDARLKLPNRVAASTAKRRLIGGGFDIAIHHHILLN